MTGQLHADGFTIERFYAGGTMDGYRRRVVSTLVEIRNLEGSP
jgi:hypothetical protein